MLGVNAEKEIANKFAKYYCEMSNFNFKTHKPLRILLLTELENANLNEELVLRKASINDKHTLIKFIKDFYEEAVAEKYTDEEIEEKFNSYIRRGYYVIEVKEKNSFSSSICKRFKKRKVYKWCLYTERRKRKRICI